eukprot:TRINITY_DN2427_c0_g1_i1.p1 TRINITY_DN2427_c0_g1~~TRINITY_DN2427_c0_g1_i1.p1  ORF type:complete len:271 (-),score=61.03 TRINITY_DN2427_c0_g1_i1:116-928(-)
MDKILSSKFTMPVIGLGVFESRSCKQSCLEAFKVGYKHIDSAQYYRNENEVGQAVKESGIPRGELFITTKVMDINGGEKEVSVRIQNSLRRIDIEYLDLLLIHSPIGGADNRIAAWKAFEQAVDSGKVRSIGVSNYGVKHLKEVLSIARIKPVVNQIELHPWCQQKDIVKFCQSENIVVQAYTPLTRGKNFGDPVLQKVSHKHNKTPAQILVKWCLQKGYVPLPKSDNPDRIKSNFEVFDFTLDENDMNELDSLDKGKAGAVTWNPVNAD